MAQISSQRFQPAAYNGKCFLKVQVHGSSMIQIVFVFRRMFARRQLRRHLAGKHSKKGSAAFQSGTKRKN